MKDCNVELCPNAKDLQIKLTGRLSSDEATKFTDIVTYMRSQRPKGRIVFDCEGLEYISSAGLRSLLMLQKQ